MGQELDDATAELELSAVVPAIRSIIERLTADQAMPVPRHQTLQVVGIRDFLKRKIPAREMLLSPILPERSLSMTYSPRGVGKTWVLLSMGVAVASGTTLLRWSAPRPRNVLHVDGEMSVGSLQERLKDISNGLGVKTPTNERFRIVAADDTETGINLSTKEGQDSLEPLLRGVDLLQLDNLATLTDCSENAGDAWVPIQDWLLKLRRRGISVAFAHHANIKGRARGTSRREDVLDMIMALRRPEDYSPEQGCRFEIHIEKLRHYAEGASAPFEASIESSGQGGIRWSCCDLLAANLERAAELYAEELTVREVAKELGISKSNAQRLRKQAIEQGLYEAVQ
jgi:putative DNA primase/helicase